MLRRAGIALLAAAACSAASEKHEERIVVSGAGATFPYPLYRAWIAEYGESSGSAVNYFSVGSEEGIRMLDSGSVDFGASDRISHRPAGDVCDPLVIPTVRGAIAVAYHLPGDRSQLRFDKHVLAKMFAGRIKRWDAAEIRTLNPGVALPALPISVVHRGLGSGTSQVFSEYLGMSGDTSEDVSWPVGIAAEGNEGIAIELKVREGTIGYLELSYARLHHLDVAALASEHGFIDPASGNARYPLLARTFVIVRPKRLPSSRKAAVQQFLQWITAQAARPSRPFDYLPLPGDSARIYGNLIARCFAG